MVIGSVLGELEPVCGVFGAEKLRWIQVRTEDGICTTANLTGAGPEDVVLIVQGEAARCACGGAPADAAAVAILHTAEKKVDKPCEKRL